MEVVYVDAGGVVGPLPAGLGVFEPRSVAAAHLVRFPCKTRRL